MSASVVLTACSAAHGIRQDDGLNERQREALDRFRYGQNYPTIGRRMGVSRERARQIVQVAMRIADRRS